jgi:tRNA(Ile)-lysidine synthetase-like protein
MASGAGWERGGAGVCLDRPAILAVSGGADSMVMATVLHARCPSQVVALATFDHGTGAAASAAVSLVRHWGEARGIPVHVGVATGLPRTELAWRTARWAFLRSVSDALGVPVATAHTEDDQAETVFIRLLRDSGVRGLAGLLAGGPVLRPLLGLSRGAVRELAARAQVPFSDDPSNQDLRFLRNRVRLELLPAIERETPGFREWLLAVGRRAAAWRAEVSAAVDEHWRPDVAPGTGVALVPRQRGRTPARDEAALFWPEVAGRVGVTLDRRGTARLATFTTKRVGGLRMPLAGGAVVTSTRAGWSLQRAGAS